MTFANCGAAYDAGYANIPRGDPNYAAHLDRDNDGVACETPPAGFKQHGSSSTSNSGSSTTGSTSTGTTTANGTATLPKTGPASDLGIAGGLLLVVGVAVVAVKRRRKVRFVA